MQKIIEPQPIQIEFSKLYPEVVLASQSPNRRSLLEKGGTSVTARPQDTDEKLITDDHAEAIRINAERKLVSYMSSPDFDPDRVAISADTLILVDGKLFGKQKTREDARKVLRLLSGNTQVCITGCGLYVPGYGTVTFADEAGVVFRTLTEEEIEDYLDTDEWIGAAGAYRFQKTGWKLTERIDGDWTTVVGLPLQKLIDIAKSRM